MSLPAFAINATIGALKKVPSPEGCGCAQRKRDMIRSLEGMLPDKPTFVPTKTEAPVFERID